MLFQLQSMMRTVSSQHRRCFMTFWCSWNCHPKQLVRNFQATQHVSGRSSLAEISCKFPTHHSGSVGIDFNSTTVWGFCSLQALLAKLGFQDLCRKAEYLKKQEHIGAESLQVWPEWSHVAQTISGHPMAFYLRYCVPEVLVVFPLNPNIFGFETFLNFWLHFVIDMNFQKKQVNVSPRKTFQRLWHFSWQGVCKVSTGLRGKHWYWTSQRWRNSIFQSKAEQSTPKDFVGIKEKKVSRVNDW